MMTPSAPEQIAPVVGKNTTIVLIQNGVGIEEAFQAKFPNNTILSGVVSASVSALFKFLGLIANPIIDLGQCWSA